MEPLSDLERGTIPQSLKERPLNALSVLNHGLSLLVPRHDHEVSQWDYPVLDQELLIVVLGRSHHLHLQVLCLLLDKLLLALFFKFGVLLGLSFILHLLLKLFFLTHLFLLLQGKLLESFILIFLIQQFSFLLSLLRPLFHHDDLSRLFWDPEKSSLFLTLLCCRMYRQLRLLLPFHCHTDRTRGRDIDRVALISYL